MSAAIGFHHVSKKFKLSPSRPRSFMEMVVNRRVRAESEEFWALKDINFEIQRGETVGLVGPNGTGKSTVLRLINRIIEPTGGTISTHGRVAGLLELGAGFHPDLSGRENILLNASVLGIPRQVVKRQIDDIIDFADIGPFIDVPVRNYSSGMAMRLGFAITTTLEPEILLIDEILAVGDHSFQRKCLDRLHALRDRGVTILFVSHSLDQVQRLCRRAIWMEHGSVRVDGDAESVVGMYLDAANTSAARHLPRVKIGGDSGSRWGSYQAEIKSLRFLDAAGSPCYEFETGRPFTVEIGYCAHESIHRPVFGIAIYREDGVHVSGTNTSVDRCAIDAIESEGFVYYHLEQLPLLQGRYQLTVAIYDHESTRAYDHHHRLYPFAVRQGSDTRRLEGMLRLPGGWNHRTDGPG